MSVTSLTCRRRSQVHFATCPADRVVRFRNDQAEAVQPRPAGPLPSVNDWTEDPQMRECRTCRVSAAASSRHQRCRRPLRTKRPGDRFGLIQVEAVGFAARDSKAAATLAGRQHCLRAASTVRCRLWQLDERLPCVAGSADRPSMIRNIGLKARSGLCLGSGHVIRTCAGKLRFARRNFVRTCRWPM